MKFIIDKMKDVIYVYNNDKCKEDDIRKMTFIDKNGNDVPILAISEVTTWKEEAIKDIGGEEAFNQEYGLRFINSSKSRPPFWPESNGIEDAASRGNGIEDAALNPASGFFFLNTKK